MKKSVLALVAIVCALATLNSAPASAAMNLKKDVVIEKLASSVLGDGDWHDVLSVSLKNKSAGLSVVGGSIYCEGDCSRIALVSGASYGDRIVMAVLLDDGPLAKVRLGMQAVVLAKGDEIIYLTGKSRLLPVTFKASAHQPGPTVSVWPRYANVGDAVSGRYDTHGQPSVPSWDPGKVYDGANSFSAVVNFSTTFSLVPLWRGQPARADVSVLDVHMMTLDVVHLGECVPIVWTSSDGAEVCFAYGAWWGQKSLAGSEIVCPTITTTYYMALFGPAQDGTFASE